VVDPIPSSVNPTLPSESETQAVDPFPPIDPILPLENETQVVDLISPSVDPTLSLESKPDTSPKNLLYFNRRTSQPLGTLPQFPITLGGKTIFIDVMVVQDPLDFSLLLGRDYVYAMKPIVSTLFHVISFPHDGRVVTIDQLSFFDPSWIVSLNGSYMQTVSPPP
jgi:hypothetical protein